MSPPEDGPGDRLTALMKRAKLKNPDVARATGKDHTTVSKWRSGKQVPADHTLQQIVDLLASRGVATSVPEIRHGKSLATDALVTFGHGEVDFETLTTKQRARVWLEGLLLELAELGATEGFIADARRLLLNPANYAGGFGDGRLSDEDKLRHMKGLAAGIRESLQEQLKTKRRELPPRMALRQPPGVDERTRKRR